MSYTVGVLGGGQLGRMFQEAASRLNIDVVILDSENAPAKQISGSKEHITGSFKTPSDVRKLAERCDVITYEIEHVDTKVLEQLEEEQPFVAGTEWSRMQPSWKTVRTIQDKFTQKEHLMKYKIPVAKSLPVGTHEPQGLKEIAEKLAVGEVGQVTKPEYPFMLKSRTEAYDGRGNYPVKSVRDIEIALKTLSDRPLYAEQWQDFKMELAVNVVKTSPHVIHDDVFKNRDNLPASAWDKLTIAFPTVETIHEDSICKLVYAPARGVWKAIRQQAQELARHAVATFPGTGVFGVELFLLRDDTLVVNEIAPRPHNSGHYTIEACKMSQYQAHLRAILPNLAKTITPGSTDMKTSNMHAIMLNILGGPHLDSHLLVSEAAMTIPGAEVHLYGKGDGRPGRKMGHVTITGSSMEECELAMQPLIDLVDSIRIHRSSTSSTPAESRSAILAMAHKVTSTRNPTKPKPLIGVTMGSDTDLETLKPGLALLEQSGIPYEYDITSAHRTPQYMIDYGESAADRGLKVIICAAGGAAHLPGMMASSTCLPVVGVPVKASAMDGLDSMFSIAQMPRGVPVATVGIGNSTNAAILALRIVGTFNEKAKEWVLQHLKNMETENYAKGKALREVHWNEYQRQASKFYQRGVGNA
jgi:phosphoribosylaminoimidazole carboxylase